MSKKKGVLLVNLGSPDSPNVGDVRRYLREFLMDERVLDIPWISRFFLVHFLILPSRPKKSAKAYREVWLPEGSPLVVTSKNVCAQLQTRVDVPVELAMRYQNPSVKQGIDHLLDHGVDEILLIPLFPHYAMSSYETAVEKTRTVLHRRASGVNLIVQPPFFDHPDYIRALVANAREALDQGYDHLLFSFHGLPERQLRKSDPSGNHCLTANDCCTGSHPSHNTCYRAQCFKTVNAFVRDAGIPPEKHSVAFQSRLGRDPWLQPYTDLELPRLARQGVRRMLVICPAFVSDCLETVEEIGMRAKETFTEAGGESLELVPCMNEHPLWIKALENMVTAFLAPDPPPVESAHD
ncbi:MAG: ferrochelatase [Verrucomicrobiota bacterium]|nr:ferrochelatase [Verrucomicrobiota bacterium]MDP7049318.1 ferrochelatase [Verrucomicrobiota bacterium]